jgi:cytidylate kinase
MQLICISRGSFSVGKAFAESLAAKLGSACLGREDLLDLAARSGVAAGKLEMACLKSRNLDEKMLLEREHYQAFTTALLCERALAGPLVYHGRTGHLLLQGVPHVLRIRVVADLETRIKSVEERLGIDRAKAKKYIEQVDEDRRKWVKTFYNIDWDQSASYDFIVNLEHANVGNVASAFCGVAQLPDFREIPSSRRMLEDLLLAGRCRTALAKDDRTYHARFRVRAERGTVSVTYLPRHAALAETISRILEQVPGVENILCTIASTRILWIQERFDPKADTFKHLLEVAEKWDAAVELLRLDASDVAPIIERAPEESFVSPTERAVTGGIEEDEEERQVRGTSAEENGMAETFAELVKVGRAGGRVTVRGTAGDVLTAIDRTSAYSLVVVGDTFLSKGKAARVRLARELGGVIHDQLRVPVIQAEEMKEQYLFGPKQLVTLLSFLGVSVIIYFWVFTHQQEVNAIMRWQGTGWRVLAVAIVLTITPVVAYLYGNVVGSVLKLIKME